MIFDICKECGEKFTNYHIRKKHNLTLQQYTLKWCYNGIIPKCKCGCDKETTWNVALKDFTQYIHGHHAHGRVKSEDEKRRIGKKNSINMKRYMSENPVIAQERAEKMFKAHTPEIEAKRIEATKTTYSTMTIEDKEKFSKHFKSLWKKGILKKARKKATETWKRRYNNGEYNFKERDQKISETISQKYVNGEFAFVKGSYDSSKTGKTHHYRSSWELQFMQELDNDESIIHWEFEFTTIQYEFSGTNHKYIPDFHVEKINNEHFLVEVKPNSLRSIPRNVAKRNAAEQFCKEHGWNYLEWEPNHFTQT